MSHLRSLCKHYRNQDVILSHVNPVLDSFNGLHPEQNDFVYDDGRVELLLCITGTIEVIYRGSPYHCPLAIWLPLEYPTKPPMVRILPSSTMQIRVGRFVDPNGQVLVTYLEDWERKAEGRSLMPLMGDLKAQFGLEYPLQLISTNARPPPVTRPPQNYLSSAGPSRSTSIPSGLPPRPPPPSQSYDNNGPRRISQGDSIPGSSSDRLPPRPAYPPNMTGSPEQSRYGSPLPSYQSQLASSQPRSTYSSPPPRAPSLPSNQSAPPITSSNLPTRPPVPPLRSGTLESNQIPPRPPPLSSSQNHNSPTHSNQTLQPPPIPFGQASPSPGYSYLQPPSRLPNFSPAPSSQLPPQQFSYQPQDSVATQWQQQQPQQPPQILSQQQQQQQQYSQQYQPTPIPSPQYFTSQTSRSIPGNVSLHPASARTMLPQTSRIAVNILDGPDDLLSDISPTSSRGYAQANSMNGSINSSHYSNPINSITLQSSTSAPPPRPPNPEFLAIRARLHAKLSQALSNLSVSTHAAIQQQDLITEDLRKGEPAIRDETSRLEAVKAVCENVRSRYATVVAEGEGRLRAYEERGEGPEVDEIVCSTTVVYNQLLELLAEDAALEDTIYHLGRGLNSETANIDLDQFLKRVRGLAREQFAKRALINKILLSLAVRRDKI